MAKTVVIEVPAVPPSLNAIGSRGGWRAYARAKRQWEDWLWPLLEVSGLPKGCKRISFKAIVRFPTRRRRDPGNFSWMLEKALGDALVKRGYLTDDTGEQFLHQGTRIDPEPGPALTTFSLAYR